MALKTLEEVVPNYIPVSQECTQAIVMMFWTDGKFSEIDIANAKKQATLVLQGATSSDLTESLAATVNQSDAIQLNPSLATGVERVRLTVSLGISKGYDESVHIKVGEPGNIETETYTGDIVVITWTAGENAKTYLVEKKVDDTWEEQERVYSASDAETEVNLLTELSHRLTVRSDEEVHLRITSCNGRFKSTPVEITINDK